MSTTGNNANTPSTPKPGLFAALRGLLPGQGTSALSYDASPCRPVFLVALVTAVSALLIVSVAPALAATPPETPEVTVEAIAPTTATFNDVINPAVATFPVEAGTYQYLYRKTKTLGCGGESVAPVAPAMYTGSAPFPAVEPVSGLTPDSYYSVCLHAETTGKAVATSTPVTFESAPEAPQTLVPDPVSATSAKLHGVLNPNAIAPSEPGTYEFLYRASAIECQGGEKTAQGAVTGALGQDVEAEIPLGEPGEQYTVCLSMTNAAGETTVGPHVTFRARTIPPTVTESSEFSTEVTSSSAKLGADVNPGGGATYRFEYGTSSEYSQSTAVFSAGSDNGEHSVSAKIGGLQPDTEYHYRVVVINESAPGGVGGLDQTFKTQAAGGEFTLPDHRAWEQVSPVDKYGARIEGLTKEGGQIVAAENGSGIAYVTNAPLVPNPEGDLSLGYSQILSSRGPEGGWSTRDLGVPHSEPTGLSVGELDEYYAFTPNLESALLEPLHAPLLAPETAKENNLFIRENLNQANSVQYTPLADNQNTPPHTQYGNRNIEYIVATPNLQHIVVEARTQLTPTPEGSGVYEWNNGTFTPISILPNQEFVTGAVGAISTNVRNAVSENGELVFWETINGPEQRLYLREVPQEHTVQIDLPQGLSEPPTGFPEAVFQDATRNGERVYFKDTQKLTTDSTATSIGREGRLEPELYEYNTRTGKLTDLTANPEGPGHPSGDVRGEMIGASNNGEYVYLVADGVLAGKNDEGHEPVAEEPNLYMLQDKGGARTTIFIATLSSQDEHDWERDPGAALENDLEGLTSRMSPNGQYLAFMSERPLTGYDSIDAVSDTPDEEVFEYSAAASTANKIVCASCNPTRERPHGVVDTTESGEGIGLLIDRPKIWKNRWLAASIPGWTLRRLGHNASDYQSRYLDDSGRLFFDSADGLVSRDTNGKEDVYEFEPEGVGPASAPCGSAAGSGSVVFEAGRGDAPAGCVGLISSGTSTRESAFLDASGTGAGGEEGEDVFFLTSAPLSAQDVDDSGDVYDAHVCSTVSPCAGAATVVPPPCTTADSCKAAPVQQPAIFGAPASSTFAGQGNLAPVVVKPTVRVLTRAQRLAAALKVCRRERLRRRRVACERTARSRYGAVRKAKKSVHADRGARR